MLSGFTCLVHGALLLRHQPSDLDRFDGSDMSTKAWLTGTYLGIGLSQRSRDALWRFIYLSLPLCLRLSVCLSVCLSVFLSV